jgi:hypothetical protein
MHDVLHTACKTDQGHTHQHCTCPHAAPCCLHSPSCPPPQLLYSTLHNPPSCHTCSALLASRARCDIPHTQPQPLSTQLLTSPPSAQSPTQHPVPPRTPLHNHALTLPPCWAPPPPPPPPPCSTPSGSQLQCVVGVQGQVCDAAHTTHQTADTPPPSALNPTLHPRPDTSQLLSPPPP